MEVFKGKCKLVFLSNLNCRKDGKWLETLHV